MLISNFNVVDISLSCGAFWSVIGLSARMEENKMGNEEFLDPDAFTLPRKGVPP
ncbi:hypothetical protein BTHERMOSOX_1315 [Bathymodiolus thermophilus thioautotrophic gill symbiont]|nr:hypothetical protein BTHERMOSOX_1315 [Bathymodiolus thermophilus thioautotrophic gill symbiont]